ncbi:Glutaredoxin [Geosmithia morbida]|uniref:Glutaredoxin n=1 Tax=Geosmithia morbida TaxID=1094350 RepID=A0A9P4YVD9_9HYPO|nr:Glutaredoxin [Geosmithia morbida]KAF4122512.1 Glutaredoxin [Geosmithia morbida]
MLSPRRMRLVILAALTLLVLLFFYRSSSVDGRDTRNIQDFYHKTVNAMEDKTRFGTGSRDPSRPGLVAADRDQDGDVDLDDARIGAGTHDRLKAAEVKAKEKANEKAGLRPDPPSNVVGVGSSADGQVKKVESGGSGSSSGSGRKEDAVTEEERDAEAELNSILKKSPIIIFSKTYCPYSKKAKELLINKYAITPEPYVVELNEHPMGQSLQDTLQEKTGRRTVPNILINGVSIGGSDDIQALDKEGKLVGKIVDLGSKRIEMVKRPSSRGGDRS